MKIKPSLRFLAIILSMVFALARAGQYCITYASEHPDTHTEKIPQYHTDDNRVSIIRHMEKALEERFAVQHLPGVQFTGILFLFLLAVGVVAYQCLRLDFPLLLAGLTGHHRLKLLCVYRL